MDRKTIDGVLGTVALVFGSVVAAFYSEPALRRFGFDESSMVNKIIAGTIICGSVLALCAMISFVARRIIGRKDK
jgi:hypothetical protein